MIENIEINRLKANEKNRLRIHSGKDLTQLKESIQKLGLLHPIIISEDYRLLAGYRRFTAMKELGYKIIPVTIKRNLTELDELDIEIEENWIRKNLTSYEMDIALAKRKEIYDKLHPEATKEGSYQKQLRNDKGLFVDNKSDLDNMSNSVEKNRNIRRNNKTNSKNSHKAKRFTKVTSELLNISERTVQRRVGVGNAIIKGKIDNNTVENYKEGKISHTEILKEIKKIRQKEKLRTSNGRRKKSIDSNRTEKENQQQKYCLDCRKAKASTCPCCGKMVIICDKGYIVLKEKNTIACKDYEV